MSELFYEKWVNTQFFTEMRYKSNPKFFDTKEKIIKDLIVEFPDYNTEKFDTISMHSKDVPGINIQITPAMFHMNYENGSKIEDFIQTTQRIWRKVNKHLAVNSIDRIGARGYFIQELDDSTVKANLNKFLNQDLLNFNIDNVQLTFTKMDKEYNMRISANGSSVQSVCISNNPMQASIIKGLFVDIDLFKINILSHDVTTFYGHCLNGFNKCLDLYI